MPEEENKMRLTIKGSIDGKVMLTAAIKLTKVADNLAKADDMMASIGSPRDTVLSWARKSLGTQELAEDRAMSDRLVATLLWLACRGHATAADIEAGAREGGALECDFPGRPRSLLLPDAADRGEDRHGDGIELLVAGEAAVRLAGDGPRRIGGAVRLAALAPGVVGKALRDDVGPDPRLLGDDRDRAQVVGVEPARG
jgi:hypothetical protein